jgi:hypothetical protein
VRQEHDEYVLGHNHACGGLVGELGVERETEFGEELYGRIQILYG